MSQPIILIADDNEVSLEMLSDYLEVNGYRVCTARNGLEAVEQTRALLPSLVLMDIHMPLMNGLEAIRAIRSEAQLARTPIIALTALATAGDAERCVAAGADDYLSKPFSLKRLVAVIQSHLSRLSPKA